MKHEVRIALAGNPNCGKTTLFNALTGSNQYTGNWPGVTVERKEGKLKWDKDVTIADLPGIYSLSPYTLEEVVTRNYLTHDRPDVILNIIDGTNLERNLYLTTQLLEVGIPVVLAVNMMDLVRKNGDTIKLDKLKKELGCEAVEISALKGDGVKEAADKAAAIARAGKKFEPAHVFEGSIEHTLAHIEEAVLHDMPAEQQRWYAVKIFERDAKVIEELKIPADKLAHIQSDIAACETELDDDAESIITNARYEYIAQLCASCYKRKNTGETTSDKIDRVVTNRILGLPIFAAVMALVYWVAMGPFGSFLTDWTNDVFGGWLTDGAAAIMAALGANDVITGLVVDGAVAGVAAVLGFVPQMLVLFLMLSLLEDCGYMARVAFVMDRIFRHFGLSGKSFIPMLIGTGCGVPAVMASRTIEQDRDRKMTVMTTCFMPCGAKMPIVGLIAGALFGGAPWVALSAYFIGAGSVIVSGIMLKKLKAFAGEPAPFVMELPAYHVPTAGNVLRATWERGWSFIKRAGTVILASSIVLWFLQAFGFVDGVFQMVEDNNNSLLAAIGNAIAFIFAPLGFANWKAAVAVFTGLIAKEEVVSTFGVLYGYAGELSEAGDEIWQLVAQDFTPISAYSFMLLNLLCAPCFAAMGAIKREMNNPKWTAAAIGYMCGYAYLVALIVYQIGGLITGECTFGLGTVAAVVALVFMLYMLFRKDRSAEIQRSEFSVNAAN